MRSISPKILAILSLCIAVSNCATTERLSQVNLGMPKHEVAQALGTPYTVRGAITNKFGQAVEVWEVTLSKPKTGRQAVGEVTLTAASLGLLAPVMLMPGAEARFWLYFVNGRLARWGEAGDWGREADRIYEVRFGTPENLTR